MSEKKDENVRVIVRCRPISQKERDKKCATIIEIQDCTVRIQNPTDPTAPSKTFTFDNAYDSNAPTEAIYNDICYSLIENVLEGYNATIFAYGQTGCGKSYTMQGPENISQSTIRSSQRGIISRSFDHIFEAISVESGIRYLALASYLEIYNENIRDLLNPNAQYSNHQLKEIPGEGVIVQGLSTHTVHNAKECEDLLELGAKYRMVGATLMNVASSRSHSIFTISLEQIETKQNNVDLMLSNGNGKNNNNNAGSDIQTPAIKKGKLNLVDLAGSERQAKTGASGERLKEATKINLSLSALGNVISALVDGKTKHIPYRDSKLTRLLQDSLGGNTKTLMIACISPVDYNYDETLSTLRYASRAKNIHNKPRINEDPKDAILREYQKEIEELRKLLMQSTNNDKLLLSNTVSSSTLESPLQKQKQQNSILDSQIPSSSSSSTAQAFDHNSWLENEKEKLRQEYEAETQRLKIGHEEQQKEKEELVKDMEKLKIHYENQLKELTENTKKSNGIVSNNINLNNLTSNGKTKTTTTTIATTNKLITNNSRSPNHLNNGPYGGGGGGIQQEALNRIEMIKNALIGGERAYDVQLKEKRYKRKIAAQRRLSALAQALSRVEQTKDRDLLQEHYTDIQHELKSKNESLKTYRQKIRALEREVTDLQSEFQFDRADYLETIRRLERNLKFYQQLLDKALPILRKDGKYWDPDVIQSESVWNDDLKCWKLPEDSMNRFKLPPAMMSASAKKKLGIENAIDVQNVDDETVSGMKSPSLNGNGNGNNNLNNNIINNSENEKIADSYFRPKRITELIHQNKEFMMKNQHMKSMSTNWVNLTNNAIFNKLNSNNNTMRNNGGNGVGGVVSGNNIGGGGGSGGNGISVSSIVSATMPSVNNSIMPLSSWLPQNSNGNNNNSNNNDIIGGGGGGGNISNSGSISSGSLSNNNNNSNNNDSTLNRTWGGGLLHNLQLNNNLSKPSGT